ncbi:MAG TPA: histidinol dehydrogenase [Gemmatimonadales bacterium]|jgi:histidinol dehydrogenase|nr:histidinol dehydrogenase [Gemmatimonadales bacterium]
MIRQITVPPMERLNPFLPRLVETDAETRTVVAALLADVRSRGDAAVRDATRRFDGIELAPEEWEVPKSVWHEALDRINLTLRNALETAITRVTDYHVRQRDQGFRLLQEDGSILGMRVTPLERVGLYVPGGKACYPSTVIMNVVPAVVAGVSEIIAVTPPTGAMDAVLAACALGGVTRLFRVGGAQAIGALAYGTATVPRVDKIVGPGNRWVAEAKRQVAGDVGIDMIAGPTELVILADATADPQKIAADLVAQAEHDEDAVAWCITTDTRIADALPAALEDALAKAPRAAVARAALQRSGLLVWVPSLQDGVAVINRRAPEHLELLVRDPEGISEEIRHAGAIFLGDSSPEPVGDYLAGPSHVLPTRGTARYASPLGVYDFVKRTSIIGYNRSRLLNDADHVIVLAEAEGLMGHAEAIRVRMKEK